MHSEQGEPVERIMAAVHDRYPELDMAKFQAGPFKQWRDRGLFPRPVRRPGRGRKHGKGAIYPAGTTAQVLRILELRADGGRFDPEQALWRLWWEGWPIRQDQIQRRLQAFVAELTQPATAKRDGKLPPALTKVRRRAGAGGFEELTELLRILQTGHAPGYWRFSAALPVLYRIGGIAELRRDVPQADMPDVGPAKPGIVPIADSMRRFGQATSLPAFQAVITEAPDIDQAHRDLHVIATTTRSLWPVVAPLLSGSTLVREVITQIGHSVWSFLPGTTLYAIALRRDPVFAALLDALQEHEELGKELQDAIAHHNR